MKTNIKDFSEFEAMLKSDEIVYLFGTGISSALTGQPYIWWKWIVDGMPDNNCVIPRYDSFEELLQIILRREQERWLLAADHNQEVCNAWVRIIVRAGCTGIVKDLKQTLS